MNLKKNLPYQKYILITPLSIEEIAKKIKENIEPKPTSLLKALTSSSSKPYQGNFYNSTFSITRKIKYKNSFLPNITGDILNYINGSKIYITVKPPQYVLIFWYLVTAILGLIFFAGILFFEKNIINKNFPFINSFLFQFILFLVVPIISFKIENKKTKKIFITLLNATEVIE